MSFKVEQEEKTSAAAQEAHEQESAPAEESIPETAEAVQPAEGQDARKRPKAESAKARRRKAQRERAKILAAARQLHAERVSDEIAIRFEHVTKTYHLCSNDMSRVLSVFGVKSKGYVDAINANDDLSFEIRKGEAVAFLGLNGAGKSTALKMICGVTHPTSGELTVNGRVSALLELSAGFDKKLTGRENIKLRGQILGLSSEELEEIIPQAIEFADLGKYIDQPMRSYSSGMRARLGFALAVSVRPEILVVDEALSVGDAKFRKRCIRRIREIMMDQNVTLLFVTHSSSAAKALCSRGIVLEKGRKLYDGSYEEASRFYQERI